MKTKKFYVLLSALIIGSLLFSVRIINAQNNQNNSGNGNGNAGSHQYGRLNDYGAAMYKYGQNIDNGYSMFRYGRDTDGAYCGYSFGGPQWIMSPDTFHGMGPYWFRTDPVEFGPWFWQAYNGFDVSDIAPTWYVDPENALCIPRWYSDDSLSGPWWWSTWLSNDDD